MHTHRNWQLFLVLYRDKIVLRTKASAVLASFSLSPHCCLTLVYQMRFPFVIQIFVLYKSTSKPLLPLGRQALLVIPGCPCKGKPASCLPCVRRSDRLFKPIVSRIRFYPFLSKHTPLDLCVLLGPFQYQSLTSLPPGFLFAYSLFYHVDASFEPNFFQATHLAAGGPQFYSYFQWACQVGNTVKKMLSVGLLLNGLNVPEFGFQGHLPHPSVFYSLTIGNVLLQN